MLVHGPVAPTVSDCSESELGYTAEGFAFEGELGAARANFGGLSQDARDLTFFVEAADSLCVDAAAAEGDGPVSLGLWREDRRMAYASGPAGTHHLSSTDGGGSLTWSTDGAGGFAALSGVAADNTRLVVRVEVDTAQSITLALLPDTGDATVDLSADAGQDLHLSVTRSRGLQRESWTGTLVDVASRATLTLGIGTWAGDGTPLDVELDEDGDGTPESTVELADCQDTADCLPASGDDGDAIPADVDVCPSLFDPAQDDRDGDGVGDACDACADDPTCVCAVGTWDDDGDLLTPCSVCTEGEYCSGGSEPPAACGGATFDHDYDPSTPCAPCDTGFTSPDGLTCE